MKISVLGTGAMGSRMAAVLLAANHEVTVWNRTRTKAETLVRAGAKIAETAREAVKDVDFAISMVRDDQASLQLWLDPETGALANLPPDCVVIESSTVTPAWARELAAQCRSRKIEFLDAPVAGSRPQAEAAQLIYLVGGAPATLAKAEPILRAMGASVHHAGIEPGSGALVKLAINSLFGIQIAAIGEIIGLLRNSGVEEARAIEIITATPVCSPAVKVAASAMLAHNFAPQFPVELVAKDFGCTLDTAAETASAMPMTHAAGEVFARAIEAGYAADNLTGVVKLYLREKIKG